MLFPITPHICEYIWNDYYSQNECIETSWPMYQNSIIEIDEYELIIQVNGKVRGKINVNKELHENELQEMALKVENVSKFLKGFDIKKVIFVKEKLINFVI